MTLANQANVSATASEFSADSYVFNGGSAYSFTARISVTHASLINASEDSRNACKTAVENSLRSMGRADVVPPIETENGIANDFVAMRINFTPTDSQNINSVNAKILYGVRYSLRSNSNAFPYRNIPLYFAPIMVGALPILFAGDNTSIDKSTIRSGYSGEPPDSASGILGAVTAITNRNSTDPTRNGNPLGRYLGNNFPFAAIGWAAGITLGVLGVVAIGYSARGIAQLVRETK